MIIFEDLILESERLKTFKNWPFQNGPCTAQKMSESGFFMPPQKKNQFIAKCYFCSKELDGWEKTDIPMIEHKKHASYCPLIKKYGVTAPPSDLSLKDLFEMEIARVELQLTQSTEAKINAMNDAVDVLIASCDNTKKKRRPKKK